MIDTLQGLSLLTIMGIVGPIVLAAAIIYGIMHARRRRQRPQADAATQRVYEAEERRRKREHHE